MMNFTRLLIHAILKTAFILKCSLLLNLSERRQWHFLSSSLFDFDLVSFQLSPTKEHLL